MNTAKAIEKAIESLPNAELKEFRAWFAEFDSRCWDSKIEQHATQGKLSSLAQAALKSHNDGKTKEI